MLPAAGVLYLLICLVYTLCIVFIAYRLDREVIEIVIVI